VEDWRRPWKGTADIGRPSGDSRTIAAIRRHRGHRSARVVARTRAPCYRARLETEAAMHYPHKISRIKKVRAVGFRKRMSTRKGRKIINSKRRLGRAIRVR
jgi:ribosomal protein L34